MVHAFIDRIRAGGEPLIAFEEIVRVIRGTLARLESIKTRQALGV